MKRLTGLILMLAMLLCMLPMNVFAASASFNDVTGGEYYASSAKTLAEMDILKGYEDGSFGADRGITRAEMAAIICRILDKEAEAETAKGETVFKDVPASHWACGYINVVQKLGIIAGHGDGNFKPDDNVKYEEAIKMLVCAFDYDKGMANDPTDWSKPYLKIANEKGLLENAKGAKGTVINRGDIAVITLNAIKSSVAAPVASHEGGSYGYSISVALTSETKDAEIYYTTDGTTPTTASKKYTGKISVWQSCTLKAIAVLNGSISSDIMSEEYKIAESFGSSSSSDSLNSASIRVNGMFIADGTELKAGDALTVSTNIVGCTITWYVGTASTESASYTVTNFDAGKTIYAVAEKDSETVTTLSYTVKNEIAIDLAGSSVAAGELPSAPVVVASGATFHNADGSDATIDPDATVSFTVEAQTYDIEADTEGKAAELTSAMTTKVNEILADNTTETIDEDKLKESFNFITVDAALNVKAPDATESTEVHPVGEVVLTFTAEQLGITLGDGEKLSDHYIVGYHTNVKGEIETQIAEIVTDEIGNEYAKFTFNGLSIIWLGNCPPSTVTFDTDGGTEIASQKVVFGGLVNTTKFEAPKKDGYLFCGWNYDLAHTYILNDMTITAKWVEGIYLAQNRFTGTWSVTPDPDFALDIADGSVTIKANPESAYAADLEYSVAVTKPANAVEYAMSATAEGVMAIDEYQTSDIVINVKVTDENGTVIPGKTESYIKWIDANGEILVVEAIAVTVDNGLGATEQFIYTANVDRGVGTFEAYLIDTDGGSNAAEPFVAYINAYLQGTYENYELYAYANYDEYRAQDMYAYDAVKFVFTAFDGGSFNASQNISLENPRMYAYKIDTNTSTRIDITNHTLKVEDGKLILTIPFKSLISQFSNMDYINIYGDLKVDDSMQEIYLYVDYDNGSSNSNEYEDVTTDKWSEALTYLASDKNYRVTYTGGDVVISDTVTVKMNSDLYIQNANLTVANGGTLVTQSGTGDGSIVSVRNGSITVESGGTVRVEDVSTGSSHHSSGLRSDNVIFKTGSSLVISGFANIYPYSYSDSEKEVFTIENGVMIKIAPEANTYGHLNINNFDECNIKSDMVTNNTYSNYINIRSDKINVDAEINIGGYGYLETEGEVNIGKNGAITINTTNKWSDSELNGPVYNNGTITVTKGSLMIRNVSFASYNYGTISVGAEGTLYIPGTRLVNAGTITGTGIVECSLGDDYTDYHTGVEYVEVENDDYYDSQLGKYVYKTEDYTRYKFTSDPAKTVDAVLYKGDIINEGTGSIATSLTVNTEEFPEVTE